MNNDFWIRLKTFWNTSIPDEQTTVSVSFGLKFLLFFSVFFIIVKFTDPLDEILHVFKIGFALLCSFFIVQNAQKGFIKITKRKLITRFGHTPFVFLIIYSLAVAILYFVELVIEGSVKEGWIWKYYWKHLPFAILVTGIYFYREYKNVVADHLVLQLNEAIEQSASNKNEEASSYSIHDKEALKVSVNGVNVNISPKKIIQISVNGHYLDIYYLKEEQPHYISIRKPLNEILKELPSDLLVRIHRSHIVNMSFITKLKKLKRQYFVELLHQKDSLPISKTYLSHVLSCLEEHV